MHRWKTPLLCALAFVAAALAYNAATALAVTALWMPQPGWWTPPLSRTLSAITWLHVAQGIGVLAAALPFALALRLAALRRPVALAFGLSIAALVLPNLWLLFFYLPSWPPRMLASTAVDFIKWLCVLPLLTWMLLKVQPRPPAAPPVAFAG